MDILKTAISEIKNRKPNLVVHTCIEYDTFYVVDMQESKNPKPNKLLLDSSYAIEKKTGKITVFRPWKMKKDQLRNGKKLSVEDN